MKTPKPNKEECIWCNKPRLSNSVYCVACEPKPNKDWEKEFDDTFKYIEATLIEGEELVGGRQIKSFISILLSAQRARHEETIKDVMKLKDRNDKLETKLYEQKERFLEILGGLKMENIEERIHKYDAGYNKAIDDINSKIEEAVKKLTKFNL